MKRPPQPRQPRQPAQSTRHNQHNRLNWHEQHNQGNQHTTQPTQPTQPTQLTQATTAAFGSAVLWLCLGPPCLGLDLYVNCICEPYTRKYHSSTPRTNPIKQYLDDPKTKVVFVDMKKHQKTYQKSAVVITLWHLESTLGSRT